MNILFAGTPDFAAQHLKGLLDYVTTKPELNIVGVITQPDKPGKRGKKAIPSSVKRIANATNIPLIQPAKLSAEHIEEFKVDLIIVVAYGQILSSKLLNIPTYGCINVHASILPRWRGAAPIQRSILAGDTETGICIMQMDKGLDTGDILASQTIPIQATDTTHTLSLKLAETGLLRLIDVIDQISTIEAIAQPDAGTTYAHKINKHEAQCNWQKPATELDREIRAFNPDPISFSFLGELRVKIRKALPQTDQDSIKNSSSGEIIRVSKQGVLVTCGTGNLLLKEIQLPIGKGSILTGADILNARTDIVFPGAKFM